MLNNREIAVIIWGLILLIYAMSMKNVRSSLRGLLFSFLKLLIHPSSIIALGYISIMLLVMYINRMIGNELIKDYVVWIIFGLVPLMSKVIGDYINIKIKSLILSIFEFSIIPFFIINEYTLSLWAELIIVPFISMISLMVVIAETDPQYLDVKKVLNYILGLIGSLIIYFAFNSLLSNISDMKQIIFWEKMFIDIIGIILHLPLLFLIQMLCFYEQILIRTNLKSRIDKLMAILIIFKRCHFSKDILTATVRNFNLRRVSTVKELSKVLSEQVSVDIA